MTTQRVVVLGAGSAGEHFVGALRRRDPDVEIVIAEQGLAGGECSYYACLPTKTLLRSTEALAAARIAPGAAEAVTGEIDLERVLWWRDQVTDGRDDSWHAGWLEEQGAELVRGAARVVRPGVVAVGERELAYDQLVVATGSQPSVPALDGIQEVDFWTNREAIWATSLPESLVVLGGGPVGVELAQFFRRMGVEVVLVESNEHLLARLDPDAGTLLAERLEQDGIRILVQADAKRVERSSAGVRVELASGEILDAERLLVATGRRPSVDELGLEQLGVEVTERGVKVDDRLSAADGVWAIGDAAGDRSPHASRQVPGPRRRREHRRTGSARRLPGNPRGGLHRSSGGLGRRDGGRRRRVRAVRDHRRPSLHIRAPPTAGLRQARRGR